MNWYKQIFAEYDQQEMIERLSINNPYPFKAWFNEQGRDYVPFMTGETEIQEGVDKWVAAELEEKGYQITDYRKGYCSSGNRVLRIGKVLNSLKQGKLNELNTNLQNVSQEQDSIKSQILSNQLQQEIERSTKYYDELIETFTNSSYRTHQSSQKVSEFSIVISQNPHDVAQMSTGRQWTSCMNLGGEDEEAGQYHEDVYCEVQKGGLVAYLIRSEDTEIEDPLARVHIRRFDNRKGQSIAVPEESVYGNEINGFLESVKSWLKQKQEDIVPGAYKRQGGQYSDTFNDNMFIAPSNSKDILAWLRGEGEDAQYSTWSVEDHLFLDVKGSGVYDGDDYYNFDIQDYSKTFKTKEEAEEYLEKINYSTSETEEDYRETLIEEGIIGTNWTDIDEETGEYEEKRFYLQENKTDHRKNMINEAINVILKAPKGEYPLEVIEEIKETLFGGSTIYSLSQNDLLEAYPELFSHEEIQKMNDKDQLKIFKKLSPEKQEQQRQGWVTYINDTLDDPMVFHNEEVQRRMRERDEASNIKMRGWADDSVGMMYALAIHDWLIAPLEEVFKPIPEPIIQKLVNFGENFIKEDNPIAPYKDLPKYDEQILSDIVMAFSHTKSDTPTVQRFYKNLLPLWKDNRETYYDNISAISIDSLGRAIGNLGENGRDFLPFINNKIEEEKQVLSRLEESIKPEERERRTTKDYLRRAYKKIEKLFYIKKEIDLSIKDTIDYKWSKKSKNWYKQAQKLPCQDIINRIDSQYPLSDIQEGDIANLASISASLNEWQELRGIRDIPSLCSGVISENKSDLAEEIKASGYIMPLIVVIQSEDDKGLYILEGSHRYDAICELGYKTFPALVVIDTESLCSELV